MPSHLPELKDQTDVLHANETLSAENARLTADLAAATELIEAAQAQTTAATARADTLEIAAKAAAEELTRLKAQNAQLSARQADLQQAVAAEVQKLGLRPKAAEHQEAPAATALTPDQQLLAAKGFGSMAELRAACEAARGRK